MARQDEFTLRWKQLLGPKKGEFLSHFWHEQQRLIAVWTQLNGLLTLKKDRVAILQDTVPAFIRVVMEAMWRDLIISLCVYMDPPGQNEKQSVSFHSWFEIFGPDISDPMRIKLKQSITDFCDHMAPIILMRNKHIAHKNHQLLLSAKETVLHHRHLRVAMNKLSLTMEAIFESNGIHPIQSNADREAGGYSDLVSWIEDGLLCDQDRPH